MASGLGPNFGVLIEVLVATGLLTAISETVRWRLGRGKERVDNAKIVQGMALDLLQPLHTELDGVRKRVRQLDAELEAVLGWALIAHALLDANNVRYPEVPKPMIDRLNPS